MASILIKNIPPEIHSGLKANAQKHHRSLNREIISVLEKEISTSVSSRLTAAPQATPDYSESALAAYPREVAARLRSLRDLGGSLAARQVDFEGWKNVARESRR